MQDDFVVADFAEAWLAKFPRIEERGLGPRLLAALAGMSAVRMPSTIWMTSK